MAVFGIGNLLTSETYFPVGHPGHKDGQVFARRLRDNEDGLKEAGWTYEVSGQEHKQNIYLLKRQ